VVVTGSDSRSHDDVLSELGTVGGERVIAHLLSFLLDGGCRGPISAEGDGLYVYVRRLEVAEVDGAQGPEVLAELGEFWVDRPGTAGRLL
jgi:hypothetical protein